MHTETKPKRTPLHSFHIRHGGRMVDFVGWSLPMQYEAGILAEHRHCRQHAALFDVSHMGQATINGPGADQAVEALITADLIKLEEGQQRYTLLTTPSGGVIDDLMIGRLSGELRLVVNASRRERDWRHVINHLPEHLSLIPNDDRALLALQGPAAAEALSRLFPGVSVLPFMALQRFGEAVVSRSGYTGEDGFEISLPARDAQDFAEKLLKQENVLPAGLGARDSLRLEAGLCLYGHELNEEISPVAAGLSWVIAKRRCAEGGFMGAHRILPELIHGAPDIRVGLRPLGHALIRQGSQILMPDHDEVVGNVTSGGFSPNLNAPIAMGMVPRTLAVEGTPLRLAWRNRMVEARVVKLPFVPHRYPKPAK